MEKSTTSISRAEFLRSLGLSGAALFSIYCLGSVTSCTNKKEDPQPTPGGSNKVDFTLDVSTNSDLTSKGFTYNGNIIVAKNSAGSYVAVSKICTHQGSTIEFESANNRFHCPNHGSNFATDGSVQNGPATTALKQYNTTLTGNSLRVFES